MEVKKIDILPIELRFSPNISKNSTDKMFLYKAKILVNSSFNLDIQKKREEFWKELQQILKNLDKYLERINRILDPLRKELRVEIDQDLNIPIFKIIDKETNEVIRQIPLEEILKLIKNIEKFLNFENVNVKYLKGFLLKTEV